MIKTADTTYMKITNKYIIFSLIPEGNPFLILELKKSDLKVTYKENTYKSNSFDHGNPPEAIKKLITKINSFAKKE